MLVRVQHEVRIGRIAKRQPREDAAGLVVFAARRKPELGLVRRRADWPADDIGRDDPLCDRFTRDLLPQQARDPAGFLRIIRPAARSSRNEMALWGGFPEENV